VASLVCATGTDGATATAAAAALILAVLIDGDGRPVCSEMWPGNTADVIQIDGLRVGDHVSMPREGSST
jgi:hypothetical protein